MRNSPFTLPQSKQAMDAESELAALRAQSQSDAEALRRKHEASLAASREDVEREKAARSASIDELRRQLVRLSACASGRLCAAPLRIGRTYAHSLPSVSFSGLSPIRPGQAGRGCQYFCGGFPSAAGAEPGRRLGGKGVPEGI